MDGMVHDVTSGQPINAEYYLRNEYQFYYLMNTLPVPSVTLMPQIVMGGGLGFCHSTTFRIASEKTRMAMPETKIGLFPDVGGGQSFQVGTRSKTTCHKLLFMSHKL